MRRCYLNKLGFTLIELLVVIGIIALLTSILNPVLGQVRKQSRAVACKANLRQWGFIYYMHTSDNDGRFDNFIGDTLRFLWTETLQPYYKNERLLFCPSAKKLSPTPFTGFELGDTRTAWSTWGPMKENQLTYEWGGYGMSIWVVNPPPGRQEFHGNPLDPKLLWRTVYTKGASEIPVLLDCAFHAAAPYHTDKPPVAEDVFPRLPRDTLALFSMDRHEGGVNGLFMDWSARKVGLKELWELNWHQRWYEYYKGNFVQPDYRPPEWPEWMSRYKNYAMN